MTEAQKPRKLIFHIGHHKTGTTSIQSAFATGRVRLEGGRILYPGRLPHNYLRNQVETYVRSGQVMHSAPGTPNLASISERMQRGDFDVTVISGEKFEWSNPLEVQQAIAEFMLPHVTDHTVICYVRPHAGRLLSGFAESLKVGLFDGILDDFVQRAIVDQRLHYFQLLDPWVNVFGDHLCIRPMIRSELAGGDALQDFIKTGFGSAAPVTVKPGGVSNESLCLEDLLVVKLLQSKLGNRDRRVHHAVGWDMAETLASTARVGSPGTKLKLHKSLAETIRAAYIEDADAMDARFFGKRSLFRDDLDRSVDEALPKPQSLDPEDYFSADALRTISVLLSQIAMMLGNETGNWAHFLRDRRVALLHGETPDAAAGKVNRSKKNTDRPLKRLKVGKKAGKGNALSE